MDFLESEADDDDDEQFEPDPDPTLRILDGELIEQDDKGSDDGDDEDEDEEFSSALAACDPTLDDERALIGEIANSQLHLNYAKTDAVYEDDEFEYTTTAPAPPDVPPTYYWNQSVGSPGLSQSAQFLKGDPDPMKFFDLLVRNDIVQWIVDCTNDFALSKNEKFIRTDIKEIKALFGACLYIGARSKNASIKSIFSSDMAKMAVPVVLAFSRARYSELMHYIRFDKVVERQRKNDDRLLKIRKVFENLIGRFQEAYVCGDQITVDEAMIPYVGHCGFVQYAPKKPCKYGIKVWACSDAKSAYLHNAEVYTGKMGTKSEAGQPFRVAMEMSKTLQNCGRTLTTDNYYTSPRLAVALAAKRTYCLGTFRPNKRGIPRNFANHPLQDPVKKKGRKRKADADEPSIGAPPKFQCRSAFLFGSNKGAHLTLVKFETKPKKTVFVLSTYHHADLVLGSVKATPQVVLDYNKTKIGVDLTDQMLGHFAAGLSTVRWPLRIFFWLLDAAALNAYILFRLANPVHRKGEVRRNFLLNLSSAMLKVQNKEHRKQTSHWYHLKLRQIARLMQQLNRRQQKKVLVSSTTSSSGDEERPPSTSTTPQVPVATRSGRMASRVVMRKSRLFSPKPSQSGSASSQSEAKKEKVPDKRKGKHLACCQMPACKNKGRKGVTHCFICERIMCGSCTFITVATGTGKNTFCQNCV